ncbi:hypothetical protein ANN_06459 [Periplaneta americana]|uniref:Uncharacterized protein n=1 Tax=Periplaneta americana TaxID=6978 RepID=A0ABQ8TFZ0_PERAM|nr:hypothetical protein ANN_06459 [Periplaneta americana]
MEPRFISEERSSLFGKDRGLLFDVVGEKRVEWGGLSDIRESDADRENAKTIVECVEQENVLGLVGDNEDQVSKEPNNKQSASEIKLIKYGNLQENSNISAPQCSEDYTLVHMGHSDVIQRRRTVDGELTLAPCFSPLSRQFCIPGPGCSAESYPAFALNGLSENLKRNSTRQRKIKKIEEGKMKEDEGIVIYRDKVKEKKNETRTRQEKRGNIKNEDRKSVERRKEKKKARKKREKKKKEKEEREKEKERRERKKRKKEQERQKEEKEREKKEQRKKRQKERIKKERKRERKKKERERKKERENRKKKERERKKEKERKRKERGRKRK